MSKLKDLYRRLDDWALGLSRRNYAVFIGVIATLSSGLVSLALGELKIIQPLTLGLTLGILFYIFDANNQE
jgi:hypothetical protein